MRPGATVAMLAVVATLSGCALIPSADPAGEAASPSTLTIAYTDESGQHTVEVTLDDVSCRETDDGAIYAAGDDAAGFGAVGSGSEVSGIQVWTESGLVYAASGSSTLTAEDLDGGRVTFDAVIGIVMSQEDGSDDVEVLDQAATLSGTMICPG